MEKDRLEKYLEAYPDVFADIVNVLLFGQNIVKPEDLYDGPTEAIYKAENGHKFREQRRDISKYVKSLGSMIALYGIENQSSLDADMVFRVMGYDYASYRSQIDAGKERYPVITVVLYFGDKEWKKPCSIHERIHTTDFIKEKLSDYRINVIDVQRISKEVRKELTSDFGVVAEFFAERRNPHYMPSKKVLKHAEAVLKLLEVFTGDERYRAIEEEIIERVEEGGELSMCEFAERMEKRGIEQGIEQGIERGIEAFILDNLEEQKSREQILEKLKKRFQLTENQANMYLERYAGK